MKQEFATADWGSLAVRAFEHGIGWWFREIRLKKHAVTIFHLLATEQKVKKLLELSQLRPGQRQQDQQTVLRRMFPNYQLRQISGKQWGFQHLI